MPSDLVEFLEWTLRLEARKRPTIDQCANHVAFQILKIEASEKENRKEESDSGTEGSWKEIQFEEPCVDSREEGSRAKTDENELNSEKVWQAGEKNEVVQKQTQTTKSTALNRRGSHSEIGTKNGVSEEAFRRQHSNHQVEDSKNIGKEYNTSKGSESRTTKESSSTALNRRGSHSEIGTKNGVSEEPFRRQHSNHQIEDSKNSASKGSESRTTKDSSMKESLGGKAPYRRKNSTDIRLELGILTKQSHGKYNKISLNNNGSTFGKISANDMVWSTQQASYLNSGQRGFQSKAPYGHIQNQVQVLYRFALLFEAVL